MPGAGEHAARRAACSACVVFAAASLAPACGVAAAAAATAARPVPPQATAAGGAAFDAALDTALLGYESMAESAYAAAASGARALRDSVTHFLAAPDAATLDAARRAWLASHQVYDRTEVYRFAGGPIDDVQPYTGQNGPEPRINAWPVDEAFLDYVAGASTGGLIGDIGVPMTRESLVSRNGTGDDTQVTLGYHAIEFLLWGQDHRADGPGERPAADYIPGDPVRDRRRACLALECDILVDDLAGVTAEWQALPGRYATWFRARPRIERLGRALTGPATLAGFELASERIGVPLASSSQEFEESCFSDDTHHDYIADVEGIRRLLEGDGTSPGLATALEALDPAANADIEARLGRVRALAAGVTPPVDAIIVAPKEDPRRRHMEALAGELIGLAGALVRTGREAGAEVYIGGGG